MANPSKYMHLTRDLEILLSKKCEKYISMLEQEVRDCAKGAINEDRGGLTNSIYVKERTNTGGAVCIGVPYAKFVNDGRGPIVPIEAEVLSNLNTSGRKGKGDWNTQTHFGQRVWNSQGGHSPFVAKYADGFEGHHFVEEAMKNVADAIERGE